MALRTSNERDQQFVRNALPDGFDWLIAALPALGTGEAVVAGEGVSVPMQIQFRALAAEQQPASQTPAFSHAWSQRGRRPSLHPPHHQPLAPAAALSRSGAAGQRVPGTPRLAAAAAFF